MALEKLKLYGGKAKIKKRIKLLSRENKRQKKQSVRQKKKIDALGYKKNKKWYYSFFFIEAGSSFPSGHATFFMGLAVALFFIDKKIGYLFMFFALIIGLARIIAGAHFPVDILGGFILGSLVSVSVAYFAKNV